MRTHNRSSVDTKIRTYNFIVGGGPNADCLTDPSLSIGWEAADVASMPAEAVCERLRRRYKNAATAMEISATPPTTPPAMGPAWLLECEGVGDAVEDAPAEDVNTPEGPKNAPGPYSGLSISNVGVRP